MINDILSSLSKTKIATLWITYLHELKDPLTGEFKPFYAGACRLSELFNAPDAHKNSAWREYMTANPDAIYRLRIMNVEEKEAYAVSNILTLRKIFNPYCNANGIFELRSPRIKCIQTGTVYENAAEASKMLGLSPSALSNHLSEKSGYKTVKGYTFIKI